MPELSRKAQNISPGGKDGWEVHFEALKRKEAGEPILHLSVGDFDFDTPKQSVDACIEALQAGRHHYTHLAGVPQLRQAMANVSTRVTGVETPADQVIVTAGGQAALFAAAYTTLNEGDHALVIGPYYATYPGIFRGLGVTFTVIDALPEDNFQPDLQSLTAAIKPNSRALLINSPNNPTGAVYSRYSLEAIASLCVEHDLWLFSDEVYWSHCKGDHLSPRALSGMAERTIVINSVSKSHAMTGWRVGWLTAPETVIDMATSLNLVCNYGINEFVSHGVMAAIEGAFGVEQITRTMTARRAVLLEVLSDHPHLTIRGSEGGMYVMIDIRALCESGETFAWGLLNRHGVAVLPGESFGTATSGHIRISLCAPEDELREAARRLIDYTNTFSAKN